MSRIIDTIETKRKGLRVSEMLFTIFVIASYMVPPVHNRFPFFVLDFIFVIYIFSFVKKDRTAFSEAFKLLLIVVFIAVLYTLLNDAKSISGYVSNPGIKRFVSKFNQYLLVVFPLLIFYNVNRYATRKQQQMLLNITIVFSFLVAFFLLDRMADNAMIARDFQAQAEGEMSFIGWTFVYSFTFFALLFYLLMIKYRGKERLLYTLLFLFSFYFLFRAQYTLSLVTTVISMSYITVKYVRSSAAKLLFFVVILFSLFIMPYLMDFLISVTESVFLKGRFAEIRDFFLLKSDDDSDLSVRLDLYWSSIEAFIKSPIWGNRHLSFDGHATLLMCFADLGLLGGVPVWYLFFRPNRLIKSQLGGAGHFFAPFFLQIVLMGLTNPIHTQYSNYLILWFFVPLAINRLLNNSIK